MPYTEYLTSTSVSTRSWW